MKKRIWGSLLLAGLVLLSSRSAVAETTRQESIRILFEALAEQEKAALLCPRKKRRPGANASTRPAPTFPWMKKAM